MNDDMVCEKHSGIEARLDDVKEGLRNGMRIFIWVMGIVVMMLVGTMGYLKGIDSKGSDRSTAIAVVQTDVKHIQRTLQRIEKAVDK